MAAAFWISADDVFDQLEGSWSLERIIEGLATMEGVATFTRDGADALAYHEEGEVRLVHGQAVKAHRDYRFERAPRGFNVLFAEVTPRLFHRIELAREDTALTGAAAHLCAPDTYDSSYQFLADGSFVIRHAVRGPRKDYVSTTTFSRL